MPEDSTDRRWCSCSWEEEPGGCCALGGRSRAPLLLAVRVVEEVAGAGVSAEGGAVDDKALPRGPGAICRRGAGGGGVQGGQGVQGHVSPSLRTAGSRLKARLVYSLACEAMGTA
jgi:hypothetical protein